MRSEEDERQLAMASLEGHLRSNGNPDIHARKPCKRRLSERHLTKQGESALGQDRLRRHQTITPQRHRTIKNMSTKNMSTEPPAATHINLELLTILQHAVGADEFGRGGAARKEGK